MSSKNTYWIADTDGTKAVVEGADERDQWTRVHGWTEANEPTGHEFVWVRNDDPEIGAARMNWQAATDPAWEARGFRPGAPPEPVNVALPPEHPAYEAARKAAAKSSAPKDDAASKPTKSAAGSSGDAKER